MATALHVGLQATPVAALNIAAQRSAPQLSTAQDSSALTQKEVQHRRVVLLAQPLVVKHGGRAQQRQAAAAAALLPPRCACAEQAVTCIAVASCMMKHVVYELRPFF